MSESFAERLSRFTPDGTGLDRDALLFAAGRASARPNRGWMAVAGALAASNAVMLALLWPANSDPGRSSPMGPMSPMGPISHEKIDPLPELAQADRKALSRQILLLDERDWPRPAPVESLAPPEPPLRAYSDSALFF